MEWLSYLIRVHCAILCACASTEMHAMSKYPHAANIPQTQKKWCVGNYFWYHISPLHSVIVTSKGLMNTWFSINIATAFKIHVFVLNNYHCSDYNCIWHKKVTFLGRKMHIMVWNCSVEPYLYLHLHTFSINCEC